MKYRKIAAAVVALCICLCLIVPALPEAAAVDETYDMSDRYKSSKYYDNFKSLELSGDGANDVLAVALSQLGYHEGNSDADLDGMNLSGNRDFVEYNVLYGKLDNNQGNGISYGYYWCASFVNWCLRQARVSKEASAAAEVSCQRWLKKCTEAGIYSEKEGYVPKIADLIFFKDKGSAVAATHMGLVLYSLDGIVCTIEGNTSNDNSFSSDGNYVAIKTYPLDSSYIVGYATPKYEKAAVTSVDRTPHSMSPGRYISSDSFEIFENGKASVTVEAHETFSVTEITDDGFAVVYEKNGKTHRGFADIENKAFQLTASPERFKRVDFLDENGKKLLTSLYLLPNSKAEIPEARPEKEGAGFVAWSDGNGNRIDFGEAIEVKDTAILRAIWDNNSYTVVFKDESGKIYSEISGFYGDEYSIPDVQNTLPDEHYFEGWGVDKVPLIITGDATYIAEIRDDTPWGRFVQSSPLTLGISLSAAFLVLGVVMLIILYRKKPE